MTSTTTTTDTSDARSLRRVGYRIERPSPEMAGHGELIQDRTQTAFYSGDLTLQPVYVDDNEEGTQR